MEEKFIDYPRNGNLELETNSNKVSRPIGTMLIVKGEILELYDHYFKNGKIIEIWKHVIPR